MSLLSRIIIGFIGATLGFLLTWKADWIYQNFGASPFAEKWLRFFGGTRLFVKLLGILIIVVSLLYITGLLNRTVYWLFSPLFSGFAGAPSGF